MNDLRNRWMKKRFEAMQRNALDCYRRPAMQSAVRVSAVTTQIVNSPVSTPLPLDVQADLERARITQWRIDNGLNDARYLKMLDDLES